MKKMKKKRINSLQELQAEQLRLKVMEKAIKTEIIRNSTQMVDDAKAQVLGGITKTSSLIQLGLAGLSLYQNLSTPSGEPSADTTEPNAPATMNVSNWLEIATDVVKIMENR
jgi:hypothetical protein